VIALLHGRVDALAVAICHAHHRSTRLRVVAGTIMA